MNSSAGLGPNRSAALSSTLCTGERSSGAFERTPGGKDFTQG